MPYVMWTPMHLLPAPLARKSALWGPRRGMDYSFEDEYDEDAQDSAISKVFGTEAKTDKEMGEWVCLGKDGDGAAEGEKRRCTAQHRLAVGHSSLQGYRVSNEDAHLIAAAPELEDTHAIMAIFDGHAGGGTSKYASQHLVQVLAGTEGYQAYLQRRKAQRKTSKGKQATLEEEDSPEDQELIRKAFTAAMADMDERLRRVQKSKACDQSGSTCVCAFVSPSVCLCVCICVPLSLHVGVSLRMCLCLHPSLRVHVGAIVRARAERAVCARARSLVSAGRSGVLLKGRVAKKRWRD